jgi:2-polyprenyl-6-methoxyphenol hydroxylase-like FAD-dependent oxidoreductase
MLANQLVRRGVRVLIIDRHTGPSLQTRALGVQARTLEIYAQLGILDGALDLGKRGTGANLWAQGRWMARVPLVDAGQDATPYPYILILGQDDNERIMGDKLRDLGIAVQWNTELVALKQAPGNVTERQGHSSRHPGSRRQAVFPFGQPRKLLSVSSLRHCVPS